MSPNGNGRRLMAVCGGAALIAMGAIVAACGNGGNQAPPAPTTTSTTTTPPRHPAVCFPDREEHQPDRRQLVLATGDSAGGPHRTARSSPPPIAHSSRTSDGIPNPPLEGLDEMNSDRVGRVAFPSPPGRLRRRRTHRHGRRDRSLRQHRQPGAAGFDDDIHDHDYPATEQRPRLPNGEEHQPQRRQPVHAAGACDTGTQHSRGPTSRYQRHPVTSCRAATPVVKR